MGVVETTLDFGLLNEFTYQKPLIKTSDVRGKRNQIGSFEVPAYRDTRTV